MGYGLSCCMHMHNMDRDMWEEREEGRWEVHEGSYRYSRT